MERISSNKLFFLDNTPRPLGWLSQAGLLRDSTGVGIRRPRVLGEYALVLLLSGGGLYRDTRGAHLPVAAGQALLIFPELGHTYGPGNPSPKSDSHWDEIYVCFQGPIFDLWRREGLLDERRPVWNVPDMSGTFQRLQRLLSLPRPHSDHENRAHLQQFLGLLSDLTPTTELETNEPLWLSTTRAALKSQLEQNLSLETIAHDVGFSAEALRKAFTRATGTSPAQFRALARLEAAKALLRRGDMKNSSIAHSLGFKDEGHFSRRFKALEGTSPRTWRANQK